MNVFCKLTVFVFLFLINLASQAIVPQFSKSQIHDKLKELQHKKYAGGAVVTPTFTIWPNTTKYTIQLPVYNRMTGQNQNVTVPIYLPADRNGKDFPIVLIACSIVGSSPIEDYLAVRFNQKGFGAAILDLNSFPFEKGAKGADKIFYDSMFAVHAYRTMIDWTESDPAIPDFKYKERQHPILSYAASNGTLTTLFSAAVDKRIQASVFVAAVGDISHIFTHTSLSKLNDWCCETARLERIHKQDMEDYLSKKFRIDTINFAPMIEKSRVLQVVALNDHVVPSQDQFKVWYALDEPYRKTVDGDHLTTITTAAGLYFEDVLDFFKSAVSKPIAGFPGCFKLLE